MSKAIIQKTSAKDSSTDIYRVFNDGVIEGSTFHPRAYVGHIMVQNNKIISVVKVKGSLYSEKWDSTTIYNGFDFERDIVIDIVKEMSRIEFSTIEYYGFDFPEEKIEIETSVDSKYIKNSLLRILENPIYSIDDQIFKAFMNRG